MSKPAIQWQGIYLTDDDDDFEYGKSSWDDHDDWMAEIRQKVAEEAADKKREQAWLENVKKAEAEKLANKSEL